MVNWNTEADAKLLAIILDVHQIKVDYAAVAARFGEGKLEILHALLVRKSLRWEIPLNVPGFFNLVSESWLVGNLQVHLSRENLLELGSDKYNFWSRS